MPLSNQTNSNSSNSNQYQPSQFGIQQHHHQQAFNSYQPTQYNYPQSHYNSLISESGYDQHENSIYDSTLMANNQYYRQNQQQIPQNKNNFGVSYLNSPQQMSTPINNRIKEQFQSNNAYNQPRWDSIMRPQQPQNAFQIGAGQLQMENKPQQLQIQSECEIHFSGKHDAIYIYLSRLLAPIWDMNLLCELTANYKSNDNRMSNTQLNEPLAFATFNEIDLQWYLNRLNELKRFLEINFSHLKTLKYSYLNSALFGFNMINTAGPNAPMSPNTSTASSMQGFGNKQPQAQQPRFATQFSTMPINLAVLTNLTNANNGMSSLPQITEEKLAIEIENGSIYLIKQFLNRIIEIFGLWKILDDHKYHFISSKLDDKTQLILMKMQIKTFLLADNSLLEKLITALLYRYIDDNACTDLLNQSLKQMCPSLYSNENAIYSKACEKLKQALNIKNDNYERERLLKEAVDLMKQIGYVANLTQVCEALQAAGCYEAVFELCLTAVEKRDPQNIGLFYYRKSEPPEDIQGQSYFNLRTECYKSIIDCLDSLIKTQGISISTSQPPNRMINSKEKVEDQINYLIKYIVNSKDELAHVSLFNWMINNSFEKKLVTLESVFLESFLIREIKDKTKNRIYLDLLWRHYDFKKDYQNAAKVLTALAEKYR